MFRLIVGALLGLLVTAAGLDSYYTVGQTERGVVTRWGALHKTSGPGLHFKAPFVDNVEKISVQTYTASWDNLQAYSQDQQPADFRFSVTYRLDPGSVSSVYNQFRTLDNLVNRVVTPTVNQTVKTVFGKYTASKAIQNRDQLNNDVRSAVSDALRHVIIVESTQLENINFSDAYEKSVEQRMLAEIEVLRIRQNADREKIQAEIVVTQAIAQANTVREKAKAEAEAIIAKGDADAKAIEARGRALASNTRIIELIQAERWDGKMPQTVLGTNQFTPLLGVPAPR